MSAAQLPPALLALSPGDLGARFEGFLARLRAACAAGLRGLLLREPDLQDGVFLELARAARGELDSWEGAWLGLHDRPHLARAVGAQGVHLGGRSLAARSVRGWLPAACALGFSSHAGDAESRWEGCDYLIQAPYGHVPGKAPALGQAGLAQAVAHSSLPLWALGGIAPADLAAVFAAGARGVAVQRGILGSADSSAAVRAYLGALRAVER